MDAPISPNSPSIDPVTFLQSTLGHVYRVKITDGRLFTGNFVCVDRQGNLVLDQAIEQAPRKGDGDGYEDPRDMGMVLVPKKFWVEIEREVGEEEMMRIAREGEEERCLTA